MSNSIAKNTMERSKSALVVIDCQNEFMSTDGNFPIPANCKQTLIHNLMDLVPRFRENGGLVVWVEANYENRSEEPLCMQEHEKGTPEWVQAATHVFPIPCCAVGTFGAHMDPDVELLIKPGDSMVTKGWYSAFKESSTLVNCLRKKGADDVYFCGLASGTCVLATILDAIVLDEFNVHAVTDCMGWRRISSHDKALHVLNERGVHTVNGFEL